MKSFVSLLRILINKPVFVSTGADTGVTGTLKQIHLDAIVVESETKGAIKPYSICIIPMESINGIKLVNLECYPQVDIWLGKMAAKE